MTEYKRVKREDEFGTICVSAEGATGQYWPGLPLDSTPTPSSCCTGTAAPTDHAFTPRPNEGGRRVRKGSTGPAPIPLDSTPTQSGCYTGRADCAEFVF